LIKEGNDSKINISYQEHQNYLTKNDDLERDNNQVNAIEQDKVRNFQFYNCNF